MQHSSTSRVAPDAMVPLTDRRPDDVLFRMADRSVTAAAFGADVRALAAVLPQATHVVNLCADRYRFTVAFCAALLRAQVSLLTSDVLPEFLGRLAARYPGAYCLVDSDGTIAARPLAGQHPAALSGMEPISAGDAIPASRLAAVVFTSGSTGEPVGHRKSWGELAARSRDAGRRFRMAARRPASVVGMVPPQHMYGFETTVLLPLHAPASSWCGTAFFPHDVRAALLAVPAPRVLVTTPLQVRALLQADPGLPPLERVISATAPLFPELAAAAETRWGTQMWEIFGATEIGSIASRRTVADSGWTTYPRIRLHARLGAGADDPVLVTAPFAEPYPLSDVVEMTDACHFRLLGRRTDVHKLGGRRFSLAALNRALTDIAGVEDGVFVAPDDLDERPTARLTVFVVAPRLSAEAVLAALRERVDPLFLPRRVIHVDALPRNATGKLPAQAVAGLRARAAGA